MTNCTFCDIIAGKKKDYKIWEDDKFIALLDIEPFRLGHCMLIPKKHIDYFFDLDDALYSEIFLAAKKLEGPLKKATNAKRIGIAVVSFSVPHAHLHLIPLHKENELFDPKLFTKAKHEELVEVQNKIIQRLKQ